MVIAIPKLQRSSRSLAPQRLPPYASCRAWCSDPPKCLSSHRSRMAWQLRPRPPPSVLSPRSFDRIFFKGHEVEACHTTVGGWSICDTVATVLSPRSFDRIFFERHEVEACHTLAVYFVSFPNLSSSSLAIASAFNCIASSSSSCAVYFVSFPNLFSPPLAIASALHIFCAYSIFERCIVSFLSPREYGMLQAMGTWGAKVRLGENHP